MPNVTFLTPIPHSLLGLKTQHSQHGSNWAFSLNVLKTEKMVIFRNFICASFESVIMRI